MDYGKIMCQRVRDIQPSGIRKYFGMPEGWISRTLWHIILP